MPLRHYRLQENLYEENLPNENENSFQNYQALETNAVRVKELVFFGNLVLFSLLSVLTSFVYLAMGIPVFWSILLASATGFIGLRMVYLGIKRKPHHSKKK